MTGQTGPSEEHPFVISCGLFSSHREVVAGISTRHDEVSVESSGLSRHVSHESRAGRSRNDRQKFFEYLHISPDTVAIPHQVHGDHIQDVDKPGAVPDCDAIVTTLAGLYLSVSVADCLPLLLFDPVARVVAAVHSGWRGSFLQIASKTVQYLRDRCSVDPNNILAFIGPAAGRCCYEVGEEVAQQFDPRFVIRIAGKERPHLDLKEFNTLLLRDAGIREEAIEVSPLCTICSPDVCHSYRRDGTAAGRMMAVIGMTGNSAAR